MWLLESSCWQKCDISWEGTCTGKHGMMRKEGKLETIKKTFGKDTKQVTFITGSIWWRCQVNMYLNTCQYSIQHEQFMRCRRQHEKKTPLPNCPPHALQKHKYQCKSDFFGKGKWNTIRKVMEQRWSSRSVSWGLEQHAAKKEWGSQSGNSGIYPFLTCACYPLHGKQLASSGLSRGGVGWVGVAL